jgi:hypothetical protein
MSNNNPTNPPLFSSVDFPDVHAAIPPRGALLAASQEAQVLFLVMQAAVKVVGRDAAFDIWDEAAELSAFSYGRRYRSAWVDARAAFGNHAPNAIDRTEP